MSEATVKNPAILAISSTTSSALLALLASSVLLTGCYSTGGHIPDEARFPESVPTGMLDFVKPGKADASRGELPVAQRMATTDGGATRLYSFKAMSQSLRVSIDQFAKANKLNVIFDQDVSGIVNVEFHDLTLEQAMDAILDPIGLGWVQEDGTIRIVREVTKTFQVDYLRAARTGNANTTSTTTGVGGDKSTGNISNNDSIDFWSELDNELKSLLTKANAEVDQDTQQPLTETNTITSASGAVTVLSHPIQQVEGRVTMNKIAGTVQVTTSPRRMKAVDAYMQSMMQGINRQVYIEARILDVSLTDDASFGIDWTKVAFGKNQNLTFSTVGTSGNGNIITAAAGGAAVQPATSFLNYTKNFPASFLVSNITAAIQALEEQGTVRVLSQPKVRAMNNQAAIMKVGTDRTFYTLNTTVTTTTAGSITNTTENANKVTEGVVLSVTPQISADGYVTLNVMPTINKIVGIDTSPSGNSNAPQVETKQTSTLVRLKDGQTAVIGGLIMEEDSDTGRQVPGVGNVPGLGWLFKGKYSNKVRKELVIFITPHLIEN